MKTRTKAKDFARTPGTARDNQRPVERTRIGKPVTAPFILALGMLAALGMAPCAHAAWKRLPDLGHDDVESTTGYRHSSSTGAKVVSSDNITHADTFVSHDPTDETHLRAGDSHIVIDLGHQEVIHGMSFTNDDMEGSITVQASIDKRTWVDLGQTAFTPADRWPDVEMAMTPVRYLKLRFNLVRKGNLRDFEIFGSDTDRDFDLVPVDSQDESTEVNLADGLGGTRVIYVHPEPLKATGRSTHHVYHQPFSFPESNEKYRTVIYDLGQVRKLKTFGSVHSPRPVRLSVYLFEDLGEKEDWREHKSFDPAVFEKVKPVTVVEDRQGTGTIKVELDSATPARYVALRWEPEFNPPAFTVGGVLIASRGWSVVPHGTGGGTGTPIVGGPMPTGYVAGMSPFGWSTGGYGGGGSLPTTTGTTTAATTAAGVASFVFNEAPVSSP